MAPMRFSLPSVCLFFGQFQLGLAEEWYRISVCRGTFPQTKIECDKDQVEQIRHLLWCNVQSPLWKTRGSNKWKWLKTRRRTAKQYARKHDGDSSGGGDDDDDDDGGVATDCVDKKKQVKKHLPWLKTCDITRTIPVRMVHILQLQHAMNCYMAMYPKWQHSNHLSWCSIPKSFPLLCAKAV